MMKASTQFQRNAEQQVEADGCAHHLGNVGGDDGNFGEQPQHEGHRLGVSIAAGLRQITARADGQPRRQRLQDDRHDVGEQRHEQQRVAELRAAGDGGGPVARVHITDRDEEPRPHEGQRLAEYAAGARHTDGGEYIGQ
jgi:hypothetical protein